MRNIALMCFGALALAACRTTGDTSMATTTPFNVADAAFIKKSGDGKIDGHAFWRDDKGGTISAAGEIIRLVPVTPYARERFAVLYKGQRSIPASDIQQVAADPLYADYTRTTRAESSGRFSFENVPPGDYYVTAQVRYKDKDDFVKIQSGPFTSIRRTGNDGGAMFETVTVTGKENKAIKLVLTNDQ